jgi:hypothetical protein
MMQLLSVFKKHPIYSSLLFGLPFFIGMQPFFPDFLQSIFVNARLIVLPILIVFRFYREFNIVVLMLFICYLIFLRFFTTPSSESDFSLILFSLLSSIAFFKFGHYLKNKKDGNELFIFLVYGITFFNISTLGIYYLISMGAIDIETFFELTQKQLSEGVFRFSIGNPIELPLTISSLLYASLLLLPNRKPQLFASGLNLIIVFISQSRIVVIIALLIFIGEFWLSSWSRKVQVLSFLLIFILFVREDVIIIIESFFNRLAGYD